MDVPAPIEFYDAVHAEVGRRSAGEADGLLLHVGRATTGGFQVLEVWESREKSDRFFAEVMLPAIASVSAGHAPSGQPARGEFQPHDEALTSGPDLLPGDPFGGASLPERDSGTDGVVENRRREGTAVPERSGTAADDPFGSRRPTSHERQTGLPWDASYLDGPAPWDVGRPQQAVVRLAAAGGFAGPVLDAGCGTGENTLQVAALGLPVVGVDVAGTALAIARQKADDRGIEVEFAVADALRLERLGRRFRTILDCGLFHTFDRDERPGYVASLASVTERSATLYVLCFSDDGPDPGPHPVGQGELRTAFGPSSGWDVVAVEPDRIETRFHDDGAPAWLATITRT